MTKITSDDPVPLLPEAQMPGRGGPSRWWRILLAVSLALNLAFVGLALGAGMKHRREMIRDDDGARELRFGPFSEAFEEDDRKALGRAFRRQMPDFRADRAALREEMAEVLPILRADPFDRAALVAAMDRLGRRATERLAKGQALVVDHIAAMSAAERQAFADRLERELSRKRRD
jgi:uncharacterized membrane protein